MNRPVLRHTQLAALILIAAALPASAIGAIPPNGAIPPISDDIPGGPGYNTNMPNGPSGTSMRPARSASATLSIEGVIKPKPCNPQFDNGGKIDFGSLDLSALANGNEPIKVGERNVEFQVFCAQAAKVRVRVRDERPDTAISSVSELDKRFHYGLGMNGQDKVGSYHIKLLAAGTAANGQTVRMTASDGSDAAWHAPEMAYAASDRWLTWSPSADHTPGSFKTFKVGMMVEVRLPPIDQLNLGEDIRLDGVSTFELKYE